MSIKAGNDLRTDPLIGTYDVPVLFGVKLAGQSGRAHQVTEHDGELAPFSVRGGRDAWCGLDLRRRDFVRGRLGCGLGRGQWRG
jgi:hypothetical protein